MTLSRLVHLRLHLLLPVRHAHVAVHRRRGGEVLLPLLPFACASGELAEAEVAAGDKGPHAARLGKCQRLEVVGLAALGIELVGMGCDVAEQMLIMGCEPGVVRSRFDGADGKVPRIVELTEQQKSAPERVVAKAALW